MVYPRKLEKNLLRELTSPRAVVLTGMRQTGKTTLMRQIFNLVKSDNKTFLDLENPLNQKVFEETNYDNILLNLQEFGIHPQKKCYLFLDEIQLMPEISRVVKYLYDHYQTKFFLTGSSSFYLKNLFPESLSGRKILYELFPLGFEEFLVFKEKDRRNFLDFPERAQNKNNISFEKYKTLFEEYLKFGGFPGVVIEPDNKKGVLEDIFTSYFEKDVKTLADFKEMRRLRDLAILLANRVGSKLEISKISSELGISRETVYGYLGFLEKTYFVTLLTPFSKGLNGEVRRAKKVYFCDTGLLNYLGKVSEGAILENAVFQNLKGYGKMNYYQKHKGPEIDFILDEKIAFEVKTYGEIKDVEKLRKFAGEIGLQDYYLITKTYLNHPKSIPVTNL